MVADVLAGRVNGRFKSHKAGADIVEARFADARVVLAKPRSYMNLSGGPTATLARFFGIEPATSSPCTTNSTCRRAPSG